MFIFALLACSTPESPPEAPPAVAPTEKTVASTAPGWSHYGEPFTLDQAQDCKGVIARPDASVDKTIRVTGHIENVCQKAGCWMVIADDEGKFLRVTMKNHDAGVPTDTATGPDTRVDVEGVLIAKKLDQKTLDHLKSEAKGEGAELDKQFGTTYEIVATGVAVKGS